MRCAGTNALNALYSVTYEMDKELGTDYHEKFVQYAKHVQENDLIVGCGMMDVKGVRPLRPHQQPDPDYHLRIVEERPDGVIVRGCKAHQTVSAISHEMIIVPSKVLAENELNEKCIASPAVSQKQIFIRSEKNIYCIGRSR